MALMEKKEITITAEEIEQAKKNAQHFFSSKKCNIESMLVIGPHQVPLPAFVVKRVMSMLEMAALGQQSYDTNESANNENDIISTGQAAKLLNVSRPYVVKLIKRGDLPLYDCLGERRRLLKKDILKYIKNRGKSSDKAMAELAKYDQELNILNDDEE